MVSVAEWLRRQVVALENEGSNPSTHPTLSAPIAQRTEHRSSDLAFDIPKSHVTHKIDLPCPLPKPHFEARVTFGNNPSQTI